jgi:hypothetical protein
MLRCPPINLNRQSEEATILLIREVIQSGIQLSEVLQPSMSIWRAHYNRNLQVFVDALGTTTTYEAYLSSLFPGIDFTVTTKADSKFKIVGAASVAAKVTRDACVDGWIFEEASSSDAESPWSKDLGSGYPSGALVSLLMPDLCLIPCPGRPENTELDKKFGRSDIWLSVARSILVDNHQSSARKRGAFSQVVCFFFDQPHSLHTYES